MKNSNPDFPPLTQRHWELLEELKTEIENLANLSALDPEIPKIRKRIDELSVKVLRFVLKPLPAEFRRPGFLLEAHYRGGRLWYVNKEIKPGFGSFHSDLPTWAKDHLVEWIRMLRAGLIRYDAREVLRETGIVGIETGMPGPPIALEEIERWEHIKRRVLEIRGVKGEESQDDHLEDNENDGLHHWLQNRNRIKVTPEILKKARIKQERKRTRNPSATWEMVIDNLVEEKLLPEKITPQALKKSLKKRFPDYPWDKV